MIDKQKKNIKYCISKHKEKYIYIHIASKEYKSQREGGIRMSATE